jgi:hypothetical protein
MGFGIYCVCLVGWPEGNRLYVSPTRGRNNNTEITRVRKPKTEITVTI